VPAAGYETFFPERQEKTQLEWHIHPFRVGKICETIRAAEHEFDDFEQAHFELRALTSHARHQIVCRHRRENRNLKV